MHVCQIYVPTYCIKSLVYKYSHGIRKKNAYIHITSTFSPLLRCVHILGSKIMLAFYPCSSVQIFHCFYCARRLELSGHYRAVSLLDKRRPGRIFLRLGVAYVHFANTNWISSAIFLSLWVQKVAKNPSSEDVLIGCSLYMIFWSLPCFKNFSICSSMH